MKKRKPWKPVYVKNGVNITALADATDLSVAHVSRILSGDRSPSLGTTTKIARYLGVSVDEFIGMLEDKPWQSSRVGLG